jgi:hypothetical protein
MSDPRILGLTLMGISIMTFLGSTSGSLPPVSFFPALALFAIGAFVFLRANHEALSNAKQRSHRAVSPANHEKRSPRAAAEGQAVRQEEDLLPVRAADQPEQPTADSGRQTKRMAVEPDGGKLAASSDISSPVEDQLVKL